MPFINCCVYGFIINLKTNIFYGFITIAIERLNNNEIEQPFYSELLFLGACVLRQGILIFPFEVDLPVLF